MILHMDGIVNARELGGIKTIDGKYVRKNVLLRSANLSGAPGSTVTRLYSDFKVKYVIDFRDLFECLKSPDVVIPYAEYHFLTALPQLFEENEEAEYNKAYYESHPEKLFEKIYTLLATSEQAKQAYKSFFEILLKADGDTVLWHCTQGKDRTGIATLLLLNALGVSKEDAIQEYMLTNAEMQLEYDQMKMSGMPEERLRFMQEILFVKQENIEMYCDILEKKYGSIYEYVVSELITEEEAKRLKAAYLRDEKCLARR